MSCISYIMIIFLLLGFSESGFASIINGFWKSTSNNTIMLKSMDKKVMIQIIAKNGYTFTWFGVWRKKGYSFTYKNAKGSYLARIENNNTITVESITQAGSSKEKEIFIWRKTDREYDKSSRPLDFNYHIKDLRISWTENGQKLSYSGGGYGQALFHWKNKSGEWISLVIPVSAGGYKSWGISLNFLKINGSWTLKSMRPMKVTDRYDPITKSLEWEDETSYSYKINKYDIWKLRFHSNSNFKFSYKGEMDFKNNRILKSISLKGLSHSFAYRQKIDSKYERKYYGVYRKY